jgi:hypothetical protein
MKTNVFHSVTCTDYTDLEQTLFSSSPMSVEGKGSIFLQNIDITAHLYKVQNPQNRINIAFTMYEMNIAYYEPYKTQSALTKLLQL